MSKKRKAVVTKRPYRLINGTTNKALRWRCYLHRQNAHNSALVECRWAEVGHTIEVVDIVKGKLLGQYTRRVNTIDFKGE